MTNNQPITPLFKDHTPTHMYAEGLVDDSKGLSIFLSHPDRPDRILCIYFYAFYAYQSTNETYRHGLVESLEGISGTVFLSGNSGWVRYLVEESGGLLHELPLRHYIVVTIDDCIDIATKHEPVLTWLPRADFVRRLELRTV